jgi:hypothetical protein
MGMGFILIFVLIRVVMGIAAAAIASHKGRSTVGWFFIGFFFDLIAIIVVAVLPNLKEQQANKRRQEREQRRLREQLRQERLKSEAYRQYSAARLDVHDNSLGIDTRSPEALTGGDPGAAPIPLAAAAPFIREAPPDGAWYYELNGERQGPVSEGVIKQKLLGNELRPNTLVWTEGFAEWTPANETSTFILEA